MIVTASPPAGAVTASANVTRAVSSPTDSVLESGEKLVTALLGSAALPARNPALANSAC